MLTRKGQISFKKLENEYAKNKEHMDRIARYKFDGEKYLLSGCLVQDEGRFRVPGSKYTTMKSLKPILKYDPVHERSNLSIRSSHSSSRSRAGSKIQERGIPRTVSKNSIRSSSQQSLRSSGGKLKQSNNPEIFEIRCAPTFIPSNIVQYNQSKPGSRSKGFRVKKPSGAATREEPHKGGRGNDHKPSDQDSKKSGTRNIFKSEYIDRDSKQKHQGKEYSNSGVEDHQLKREREVSNISHSFKIEHPKEEEDKNVNHIHQNLVGTSTFHPSDKGQSWQIKDDVSVRRPTGISEPFPPQAKMDISDNKKAKVDQDQNQEF